MRAYDALGAYTWTYGSQFVSADSEVLWQKFENNVSSFSKLLEQEGIKFEIVVAPTLYQVDIHRIHLIIFTITWILAVQRKSH